MRSITLPLIRRPGPIRDRSLQIGSPVIARGRPQRLGLMVAVVAAFLLIGLPFFFPIQPAMADSETLRPDNSGSSTQWDNLSGCTSNYECVDEPDPPDDNTTRIRLTSGSDQLDLYSTGDSSGSGTINSVTIWIRCKASANTFGWQPTAQTALRTHSTNYYGTSNSLSTSYTNYSKAYTTNPNTTSAWTWEEVDAMEIGVRGTVDFFDDKPLCTQVYAVVDYTPSGGDTTPPTPNPMTFASNPDGASTSSVSMTSTTGSDDTTPVEYLLSLIHI